MPERVSVSVLKIMASTMAACRQWIGCALNGHDTLDYKAFHIDVADPLLDTGIDSEGIHRLPLTREGKCRRTTVPLKTVVRLRGEDAVNR